MNSARAISWCCVMSSRSRSRGIDHFSRGTLRPRTRNWMCVKGSSCTPDNRTRTLIPLHQLSASFPIPLQSVIPERKQRDNQCQCCACCVVITQTSIRSLTNVPRNEPYARCRDASCCVVTHRAASWRRDFVLSIEEERWGSETKKSAIKIEWISNRYRPIDRYIDDESVFACNLWQNIRLLGDSIDDSRHRLIRRGKIGRSNVRNWETPRRHKNAQTQVETFAGFSRSYFSPTFAACFREQCPT